MVGIQFEDAIFRKNWDIWKAKTSLQTNFAAFLERNNAIGLVRGIANQYRKDFGVIVLGDVTGVAIPRTWSKCGIVLPAQHERVAVQCTWFLNEGAKFVSEITARFVTCDCQQIGYIERHGDNFTNA